MENLKIIKEKLEEQNEEEEESYEEESYEEERSYGILDTKGIVDSNLDNFSSHTIGNIILMHRSRNNTYIYDRDEILKTPNNKEKPELTYNDKIERLNEFIVPIHDASWRHESSSDCYWILFERIPEHCLSVKPKDACEFIAKLLPIMFERKVFFTDINLDNLCYQEKMVLDGGINYHFEKEVKILDCEFSFDDDTSFIYPFDLTEFRTTLLDELSKTDLIYAFVVIMMKVWSIYIDYDSLAYEVEIDRACYETFQMKDQLQYCIDKLAIGEDPFLTILNSNNDSPLFNDSKCICNHFSSIYLEDLGLLIKNDGFNIKVIRTGI
jgi:hypothetical protein